MAQVAQYVITVLLFFSVVGCGVKGDPLPPERPAEIGRGRPTFKRATEPLRQPNLPSVYDDNDEETKDEKEDEE